MQLSHTGFALIGHVFFTVLVYSTAQVLNTFDSLQEWAVREEKIHGLVKARVKKLQHELFEMEGYVKDYEETTTRHLLGLKEKLADNNELSRAKVVASNALLVHRMSHRYTTRIPIMQRVLLKKDPDGLTLKELLGTFVNTEVDPDLEVVGDRFGRFYDHLPNDIDLDDSIRAISTLFDAHNSEECTPETLSAKLSTDTHSPVEITAYHATKLGLSSFYHGMYGNAIDWIFYAQKRVVQQMDDSISSDLVLYMKEYMVKTHNEEMDLPADMAMIYLNFFKEKLNDTFFSEHDYSAKLTKRRESFLDAYRQNPSKELKEIAYYALCQGQSGQAGSKESILKCYMTQKQHPFFTIAPLKVEELSRNPTILQIFDVLTDNEIDDVVSLMGTKPVEPSYIDTDQGVSGIREPPLKTSVLSQWPIWETDTLGKKIELITGLSVFARKKGIFGDDPVDAHVITATEHIAGRYSYLDIDTRSPSSNGNKYAEDRMATIVFHINTVGRGGETIFGSVGATAAPVKGSMIYWENLNRNGNVRDDLWHASCPVIHGHKITLSTWLHYSQQFTNFKCGVDVKG